MDLTRLKGYLREDYMLMRKKSSSLTSSASQSKALPRLSNYSFAAMLERQH